MLEELVRARTACGLKSDIDNTFFFARRHETSGHRHLVTGNYVEKIVIMIAD
ncbi:hypothetical protein LU298_02775 [Komagataeibacter intermedius]|uniref:Alcohol dehydrogenase zinc-binding domain protein n=1 Tax=Komagataeibacter intermedius AF2 TaxID=1458464 RepID=A0A0N1N5B9_9PROT|nr:hypothetical protein [Komagataeibacter intermedius]KPH86911.1 Alcohol dehydrogenase zinc-binding domain protein [Komagataeibacter intermedius AF2]MCF3635429.1 hypothetical protein [Komagataeibacter intermedius]